MKRSEMVELLRSAVQESNGDFGEYDTERAEFVLSKLEKAGMNPPVREVCPVLFREKYTWEPESEQNPGN